MSMQIFATKHFDSDYLLLSPDIQKRFEVKLKIFFSNPFHPSLHFKCINTEEDIWSVRITRGYRAICIGERGKGTDLFIGMDC